VEDIFELSHRILPSLRLPTDFLNGLAEKDLATCLLVSLICWFVTGGTQVPWAMQLKAVLADQQRKETLIAAGSPGTGSGKTLPIALNFLLDDRVVSRRVFLVTVDAAELPSSAKLMNVPSMCLVSPGLEY